jgi:hypothetical protein
MPDGFAYPSSIDVPELSSSDTDNSTTESIEVSTDIDLSETQLFRADGNYEKCYQKRKGRHWTFIVYEESALKDWRQRLAETGIAFVVSPYHDKDKNPDGSQKKPHWHIIVSYPNTTTYDNVCNLRLITGGPFPICVVSVAGMYAYLTHKHNPEKYPYNPSEIERFNGWEKVLETTEVRYIMNELTKYIFDEDITEYSELLVATMEMDGDYIDVAMNHTVYFNALIRSYRHNPTKAQKRYYNLLAEGELKQRIGELMFISDKIQKSEVE